MADRKVVKIQILNVEHLKRYNDYEVYDAVVSAELLGRVYCGFLRTDARLVFW